MNPLSKLTFYQEITSRPTFIVQLRCIRRKNSDGQKQQISILKRQIPKLQNGKCEKSQRILPNLSQAGIMCYLLDLVHLYFCLLAFSLPTATFLPCPSPKRVHQFYLSKVQPLPRFLSERALSGSAWGGSNLQVFTASSFQSSNILNRFLWPSFDFDLPVYQDTLVLAYAVFGWRMTASVSTGLLGDIQAPINQKINLSIREQIAFLFELNI